jgi:hypothetical protein
VKQQILVACAVVWSGLALAAAQENGHIPVSMVEDWSSRHMIFSEDVARENRGAVLAEPRFWQQYLRRHATRPLPVFDEERTNASLSWTGVSAITPGSSPPKPRTLSHRDWSFPLGGGSGGRISGPAKFVFDVTAAPSCTTDFVVTGISANGSGTQANIIGLNRLYTNPGGTGFCAGTGPLVMFAYN